ncbi:MAG: aldo/keto reductase [Deltaproteobacteria bacterium]|nr:aldo/keto reductase [Deltaproteobacteria bacterium]
MPAPPPTPRPTPEHPAVLIALWLATLALSWTLVARRVGSSLVGIDPAGLSWGGVGVTAAVAVATAVLTYRALRRRLVARRLRRLPENERAAALERRQVLASGVAGTAAVVGAVAAGGLGVARAYVRWHGPVNEIFRAQVEKTAPRVLPAWRGARIRAYRKLGRTGAVVSDVALGTGAIRGENGEAIARDAIERGVTYFDTAPDYSGAGSEEAMGRAMRGHRDRMFVATKFCTPRGHLPAGSPVAAYMEAIEGSLRRLQTDHVDLVHVHACDEIDRLLDPNAHEAFDRLKAQGKVRFLGVSTHTPDLERVARAAMDSRRFDVMMLAYHHGIWGNLDAIIHEAAAQGIGIVAMKTLKGARHQNLTSFRDDATSYAQAAFRWVLSNPDVGCLVVSFARPEHVDEYLYASGGALDAHDLAVLERYDQRIAGTYCHPHCGVCLDACPERLAINDVLRHRMYFEDYGREKEGLRLYAALDRKADRCLACPAPCEPTCPVGIPIRARMLGADRLLRLV